ncbi:hypothetical protein ABPG75_008510 [Micractinium tetrahymenae]
MLRRRAAASACPRNELACRPPLCKLSSAMDVCDCLEAALALLRRAARSDDSRDVLDYNQAVAAFCGASERFQDAYNVQPVPAGVDRLCSSGRSTHASWAAAPR